jgi:antitoxin FitA
MQSASIIRVKNVHVRGLPDDVHATLVARARSRGVSLNRYVIEVLSGHSRLPTLDEWLDGLARLEPVTRVGPAADAVLAARAEDERELASARRRR